MTHYLGVMEQYLDLQRDMTALFLRRQVSGGRTGISPPPVRPMLGTVVRHVPGRELVMRRVLDLGEDRFAADHTVGGRRVSKTDPDQHGLPVMPMTFTLEMMAEAAGVLAPGKVVIALRNVQLLRWLAFDEEESGAVELAATLVPAGGTSGEVLVQAEVRDLGSATSPALAARATVVLADRYPPAPVAEPFRLTNERPSTVSLERMYLNLFHGPLFEGVRSTDRVGDEGIESRVEVLPRDGLFRSAPRPDLMLDPVLLDVVMHPLASWHLEQPDQAGRILLPVGVQSLEFFGPPAAPGTRLTSRGRVREAAVRSFVHEVEVVADDGRVWGRLNGVKYWRFYVPFGRVNFHGPKDEYFLSRRWAEAEGQAPPGDGRPAPFALMRLDPPTDLQQASLQMVTARVTLTPPEMQAFRRLPRGSAEAKAWLFDRIAVKDAVRTLWRELNGERLFPADIEVHGQSGGLFRARRRSGEELPPAAVARAGGVTVALSALSPALGLAVALAGRPADGDEAALRLDCARRAVGGEPWPVWTARDGDVIVAWTLGGRAQP
jgi:hypothetical protein